jgi:hypothetical protein
MNEKLDEIHYLDGISLDAGLREGERPVPVLTTAVEDAGTTSTGDASTGSV